MPAFDLQLGRHVGLTHVLDKGLGPRAWRDLLDVAGEHISIVPSEISTCENRCSTSQLLNSSMRPRA